MNILFVAIDNYPSKGGKATHISDLIEGLESQGHKCDVISYSDIPPFFKLFHLKIVRPVAEISLALYRYLFTRLRVLYLSKLIKRKLRSNQYDCISAQDAYAALACAKVVKKMHIPVVLTMHTYFGIEATLDNNKINEDSKEYKLILNFELGALNIVKSVVAVDQRIKKHVEKYIQMGFIKNDINLTSIINFTNLNRFYSSNEKEKIANRLKFNIDKDKFIVICVRRLVEKNGVIYAVKSMRHLAKKSNAQLVIVGDGLQRDEIEKYIHEHNLESRVKLVGAIDNSLMQSVYSIADIAVVPSITVNGLQEATSISAIESMACGLPTIASDIGGLSEMIKSGQNGILVPEMDELAIAKKIEELERNSELRNEISKKALEYVVNNHSHIVASKKYSDVFSSVR